MLVDRSELVCDDKITKSLSFINYSNVDDLRSYYKNLQFGQLIIRYRKLLSSLTNTFVS